MHEYRDCDECACNPVCRSKYPKLGNLVGAVNCNDFVPKVKQEWISVKDRLPNRGERVLCFMMSSGKNQNDTISDNVYNGILVGSNPPKYVWEWNGDYVTHWMPLPEPPKEG